MATTAVQPGEQVNDQLSHIDAQAAAFQALEQRVLRAIELLRKEREARAEIERQLHKAEEHGLELEIRLEEQTKQMTGQLAEKSAEVDHQASAIQEQAAQIHKLENDLSQLQGERDQVRQRVERLLRHLDEFTGT